MVAPLLPYAGLSPLAGRGLSRFFRPLVSVSSTQGESEAASFGKSHDLQLYRQLQCSLLGICSLTVPGQGIRLA